MRYRNLFYTAVSSLLLFSCTKLDEKFQGDATASQAASGGSTTVDALLKGVYNSQRNTYQPQDQLFAVFEMPTDELVGPTRGPDWDDNGVWRVLHAHAWDGDNVHIHDAFNSLNGTVYAATDMLRFNPSPQQAAEARFLRAFSMFQILDGWDQVPYRDPGESVLVPARVRKGPEALDYIISQIQDSALNDLGDAPPVHKATKDAALVLLMKCYLNKGVFANRAAPTFDPADMAKVISLADQIISSGKYAIQGNYFENFAPNNDAISKENIFTAENIGGQDAGGINSRWHLTYHYNMNPGGWNGFTTLSDFYGKFEDADTRRGEVYDDGTPNPGNHLNVGMFVGQQYDVNTGVALKSRDNVTPLAFIPEVALIETGTNLELTGIRINKYPIDYTNDGGGKADNDYVYYRYADVLLMKAEAQLRTGDAGDALDIVNQIREARGASDLASLTLDNLLDERGRELYLELVRRQDLIRFGKFLDPWQLKDKDDPKYLLFTIPNEQLAVNPNLTLNPGY